MIHKYSEIYFGSKKYIFRKIRDFQHFLNQINRENLIPFLSAPVKDKRNSATVKAKRIRATAKVQSQWVVVQASEKEDL